MRRYNKLMMDVVDIITKLHYKQRERKDGFLYATIEDNAKMLYLLEGALNQTMTGLSKAAIEMYKSNIDGIYDFNDQFTARDIAESSGYSNDVCHQKLRQLLKVGVIERSNNQGRSFSYTITGLDPLNTSKHDQSFYIDLLKKYSNKSTSNITRLHSTNISEEELDIYSFEDKYIPKSSICVELKSTNLLEQKEENDLLDEWKDLNTKNEVNRLYNNPTEMDEITEEFQKQADEEFLESMRDEEYEELIAEQQQEEYEYKIEEELKFIEKSIIDKLKIRQAKEKVTTIKWLQRQIDEDDYLINVEIVLYALEKTEKILIDNGNVSIIDHSKFR